MDEDNSKKGLSKYRQKMFKKSAIFTDKNDEKAKIRIRKEMEKVWTFEKQLSEVHGHSTFPMPTFE